MEHQLKLIVRLLAIIAKELIYAGCTPFYIPGLSESKDLTIQDIGRIRAEADKEPQ